MPKNFQPSADLQSAIAEFNRGAYFEAAELFEQAAATIDPELKDLVATLNRIAAALHLRFERGGRQSAINLLSQAMLALDDMRPECGGIDTERLFAEVSAYADEIRGAPREERAGVKYRARIFLERRRAPKINSRS